MGILKNEIMRVYDVRPTTASEMMDILEKIDKIAKIEYMRGRKEARPEGTWVATGEITEGALDIQYTNVKCSECGFTTDFIIRRYCPECGARMINGK